MTKKSSERSNAPHMPGVPPLGLNIDRCISYNLIDVNDGVCWSLKDRAFKENPIEDYQVGKASFTEVIIHEADKKTLHVANWKILTQEGYTTHNNEYLTAKAFLNKCPMLVVAQCRLDFGSADQPAIVRHLHTYHFKSLLNPKRKAAAWLREHATECVVWAAEKAKMCDDDSKDENKTKNDNDDVDGEESLLKEMEKEALRLLSFVNPPATGEIISHFRLAKKRTIMMMMLKVAPRSTVSIC